jgi:biotin operon repressor
MQERIEAYLVLREQEPKLTREQIAAELGVTRQALWHWDRKLAAQNPPIQGVKSDAR